MTDLDQCIDRVYPKRRILLIVGLLALGFALRDHLLAAMLFALSNLWQMAPISLAGLLVTAVLTATGSISLLVATFDARELLAILMVSLIGRRRSSGRCPAGSPWGCSASACRRC